MSSDDMSYGTLGSFAEFYVGEVGTREHPYAGTELERAVSIIGATGYSLWSMTLVGNAAPMVETYRERASAPRPGDLVVETSTFYARELRGYGHVAVGTLVERKVEFVPWLEGATEEDPGHDEEAWYVTPLAGGDTVRWTNASFVAIPRDSDQQRRWSGR